MKETLDMNTKEAAQVAAEDEDTEVSEAATTCRTVLSSKGSIYKRVAYPLLNTKLKKQKTSACMTVLSSEKQKGCAASSQNQSWKFAKSTKSSRKK